MASASEPRCEWTDEQMEALKALLDTRITRIEVARTLTKQFGFHVSKNAVIAKVCKLGLSAKVSGFFWSADEEAEMTALWPNYSCDEIAKKLTDKFGRAITNSAVRNKAAGLGLTRRTKRTPFRARSRQEPRQIVSEVVEFSSIPMSQRKTLMELESHHCRFIVGDHLGTDYFFCGAMKQDGSSYCPEHHALCHEPSIYQPRNTRAA